METSIFHARSRKILEMLKGNVLFTWKERKRERASGASEQIFEFTPSRTLENDLFGILSQLSMSVSITEWCRVYRLEQNCWGSRIPYIVRTLWLGCKVKFTRVCVANKLFYCQCFLASCKSWGQDSKHGHRKLSMCEHSLVSNVYYRAHHGWARKKFQNRSSQTAGKRYFEFGFTGLLSRIYRKCVIYSFVSRVFYKDHHSWDGENFSK